METLLSSIFSIYEAIMNVTRKTSNDILTHLGFDVRRQLEDMRSKGVRSVKIDDVVEANPTALQLWHDTNFPYRLPAELRAFLSASDGFSLTWTAERHNATAGDCLEVALGRIRINSLSMITRLLLDSDDFIDITSSRAWAAAANVVTTSKEELHRRLPCLVIEDAGTEAARTIQCESGGRKAYGLAAFSLDSLCEVGEVALVYGGALLNRYRSRQGAGNDNCKRASVVELTNPEVWLQDLSCRWHFLADSFTSYIRMMVVHLGVLGWQQAFTPVGLSPVTKQCMRIYCPDRLLFDQLEWKKERAAKKQTASKTTSELERRSITQIK